MITIYVYKNGNYYPGAVIDEERGKVLGTGETADMFRQMFERCRDEGLDPSDSEVMDEISQRIYDNWNNFYFMAV